MKDWEGIKLYATLVVRIEDLTPYPGTDEAWDERQRIVRYLLDQRKVHVDAAYAVYLEHNRKPWCDECGKDAVAYATGWEHVGEAPRVAGHYVELHEYWAGCEAEIIKRLKFEV
jgi:hypothetical protein